jgi:prepilin-type processing-associated H-X9-DG protein
MRRAFTVLELLLAVTILGMLLGLVLPAVQHARDAARRQGCLHNLRQIGLALALRHDAHGRFPAGWRTIAATPTAAGWGAHLVAYLEHPELTDVLDLRAPIDSPRLQEARRQRLPLFTCPADMHEAHFQLFEEAGTHDDLELFSDHALVELPTANYLGVFGASDPDDDDTLAGEGPFVCNREIALAEFVRGTSQVLLVGERAARRLPATWLGIHLRGEDAAGRVTGQTLLGPNRPEADECEFESRHPGGVHFAWGDGHAEWLADDIDPLIYRRLGSLGN